MFLADSFLAELRACQSKEALKELMQRDLHDLFKVECIFLAPRLNPGTAQFRKQMLHTGDPEFMKLWMERRLYVHDPLYLCSLKLYKPFYFHDILKVVDKPPPVRRLIAIREKYGRNEGYIYPLHGGGLSMAAPERLNLSVEALRVLDHIAQPLLDHCLALTKSKKPSLHLTPKLLEFLYFIDAHIEANSASNLREKTCQHMGITPRTYYDYWQRLQTSLGVESQTAAMLVARRTDLLPGG
jgi:autoinducer binding domain-containing protein